MRLRRLALRAGALLAILFLSLVLLLVFGEAALRFQTPTPTAPIWTADAGRIFGVRPNLDVQVPFSPSADSADDYAFHVRTDEHGFRLHGEAEAPRGDAFTILLLGDSYGFGWGLQPEASMAYKLEEALKGEGRSVRVVNASTPGQGPWQHLMTLEQKGWPFQPDLVLLQTFACNDVNDTLLKDGRCLEAYDERWYWFVQMFRYPQSWEMEWNTWMAQRSALFAYADGRLTRPWPLARLLLQSPFNAQPSFQAPPPPAPREWRGEVDLRKEYPLLREGWEAMERDITAIAARCHAKKVPLAAFNIPWPIVPEAHIAALGAEWEGRYELDKANRKMEALLDRVANLYIPLVEKFRGQPDPQRLKFKKDGHLSPEGAELAARVVATALGAARQD